MMSTHLEYAKNLIDKAENFLSKSEEELKRALPSCSNIIANCQTTIELSAKAVFKIMGLEFPKEHQLLFERGEKGEKVKKAAKELLSKEFPKYFAYREELPRLIFLTYFWHRFYTIAKYGIDELNIPPDKLFKKEDAELAIKHARVCINIANNLLINKMGEERR
ncbi:MAG: hypothetical protein B6U76_01375 [Desulfurococcales archaeon ex4484_217_2]|nr:MAG: hypothetical protein B6U76_01375 [Desulfurococcales archaeon ex4484_217_2]